MFFSIVIPLYNKSYSIKKCINSVLSQSYEKFEIIIVNDGSTDDSLSKIQELYSTEINNEVIKIINQQNQGVSVARNQGVFVSKYDYVCFLDADDEWKPWFLDSIKKLIEDYPLAVLYCLQHETQVGIRVPKRNHSYYIDGFRGYVQNFYRASLLGSIANSSKVCLKKEVFNKIGGFPENFKSAEDLYVWMEIARHSKIAFQNTVSVRINIISDQSRDNRSQSIPYIFNYYSEQVNYNKLSFWSKFYLRKVYLAHLNATIKNRNYISALEQIETGRELFPIISAPIKLVVQTRKALKLN